MQRKFKLLLTGSVAPPDAPTGLTATPITTARIDLAWTDNATTETEQRIYRSTNAVDYTLIDTIAADLEAYSDTTVTAGVGYSYKVASANAGGESLSSAANSNTLLLSLISYWKLDESSDGSGAVTRNDSHGTNHLTDNNTTPSAAGKISNGALCDQAATEYLSRASNASLQTGDIDWSVGVWVKTPAAGDAGNRVLMVKGTLAGAAASEEWDLLTNTTRFRLRASDGTNLALLNNAAFNWSADTWYFLVGWHDATANTINLQMNNGSVVSVAEPAGGGNTEGGSFRISNDVAGGAAWLFDEAAFWKRILTSDERTALYNAGAGFTHPFLAA